MCVCVCVCACARAWVTLLYSRKLTEHCKPAIMEKIKVIKIKKKRKKHATLLSMRNTYSISDGCRDLRHIRVAKPSCHICYFLRGLTPYQ